MYFDRSVHGAWILFLAFVLFGSCDEKVDVADAKPSSKKVDVPVIDASNKDGLFFEEQFRSSDSIHKWVKSKAKRPDTTDELAQYDGKWTVEIPEESTFNKDYVLALKSPARHHAISAKLVKPFRFEDNTKLIVQYEVRFGKRVECSGAYMKLLFDDTDLENFNSQSNYSIMFGPDKCGVTHKCHFIIRFKNPITNEYTEHHGQGSIAGSIFGDQQTHLFRLEMSGNKYRVLIDNAVSNSGSLLKDLTPPIVPSKEIDDPNDIKPEDWDEREKIMDESAVKPDDWDEDAPSEIVDESQSKPDYWLDDEPQLVADSSAKMPDDHDEEVDGKWEPPLVDNEKCLRDGQNICGEWKAPMIPNPRYRGKWRPPMVDNPNYKGIWSPRKVANPSHFELTDSVFGHLHGIGAIGLELWSMTDDIFFDNFVMSNTAEIPDQFVTRLWKEKSKAEVPQGLTRFESIMHQASKRPYLSSTVVIGIFLAVVAIIGHLMKSKTKDEKAGLTKKTDAEEVDDEVESKPASAVGAALDGHDSEEEMDENEVKKRHRSSSRKRTSTNEALAEEKEE